MKKVIVFVFLLLTICFALPMTHFVTSAYDLNVGNAFVISSKCEVYEEANFDKEKIVTTLKHGDQLEILEIQDKFAKIKKDDIEGYVYKFYLTCNTSQVVYPVFNASLRKDETIYDIEQNPTTFTAKKGTRVYLYDGFKDKEKFTPVQIVLEDGTLYNGYIKSSSLKPDGINSLLIVGISLIMASVTIILSLVFIKKRKKKS